MFVLFLDYTHYDQKTVTTSAPQWLDKATEAYSFVTDMRNLKHTRSERMNWKNILIGLMGVGLMGCSQYPLKATLMVGDDRDRFGCVNSAGYQWCAAERACVRPWELAKARGLDAHTDQVKQHCASEQKATQP